MLLLTRWIKHGCATLSDHPSSTGSSSVDPSLLSPPTSTPVPPSVFYSQLTPNLPATSPPNTSFPSSSWLIPRVTMANPTARISRIPDEALEGALTLLHPVDTAKFSQTCHSAHAFVYGGPNQYLGCELFCLYPFDDPCHTFIPQHADSSAVYDW
jgi:hypothetical protein